MLLSELIPQSGGDFLNQQLPDLPSYIAPAILPKGGKLIFGGHSKIGKSWLSTEFARSLITGTSPFDCPLIEVPRPVRVLYLEAEIGPWDLQRRLRMALSDVELELIQDNLKILSRVRSVRFDDVEHAKILGKMCRDNGINVLILDPISKMHAFNENSNDEINKLFNALDKVQEISEETDLAIIFSHHFGKPWKEDTYDKFSIHNFRGASKFVADPDTIVTVVRSGPAGKFGWKLETKWETRQGIPPLPDGTVLTVMEEENGRVLWKEKKEVEKVKGFISHADQ